jgi:hypothetical protein
LYQMFLNPFKQGNVTRIGCIYALKTSTPVVGM